MMMTATLICFGFASSAPGQTTNKSTHARSKSSRVNVNTADAKTLETLPGVTASLANKIIAGRPYNNADDLKKVKGLTETKINGLKNHITFGPTTTTASTRKTHHKEKTETASNEETNAPSTATASTKKSHKAKTETASNEENEETTTPSTTTGKNSTGKSMAPLAATGSSSGTSTTSKKTGPSEPININTASLEQLEELPGIGPTRAQAILDYRQQNGNFGSIEDIEKVKGIKEGEFSKIKDMIKVE